MAKNTKKKEEPIEGVLVDEEGLPKLAVMDVTTSMKVESFGWCITEILGMNHDDIVHLDDEINLKDPALWHEAFTGFVKHIGYDFMFFKYDPPLDFTETDLSDYTFANMPSGKGILVGESEDELGNKRVKSVVILITEDKSAELLYDPFPDSDFTNVNDIAFFIRTFMEPTDETVSESSE